MTSHDVVVVGAGHNGLAAAIILAEAGRRVTVLERNPKPGGALQTDEVTLPGFRHDLMATNLNLFMGSPFFAEYGERLGKHGFEVAHSTRPACSLFPGGGYVGLSTDVGQTLASIREHSAADAEAFLALQAEFERLAPHIFALLGLDVPSKAAGRALWRARRVLGRQGPFELARLIVQSSRQLVEEHFESPEVQSLIAAWGMHLDFSPDVAGGAMFSFLETMASQANGMVMGKGGGETLIDAMVGLLLELGGEIACSTPVEHIEVQNGAATKVITSETAYSARRAVIATLTPTQLFGRLVDEVHLDEKFRTQVRRYRYGPGTLMIHLALADLPPWTRPDARQHAYVHIGPYLDDMERSYRQAISGVIPDRPTLVVGQPTVVDPSRAPEGKHVLWVQARMFPAVVHDADWAAVKEAVADQIMDHLEQYAPGLGRLVLGRYVMSPADLEAANPNLVGGDSLAGSHHLMQNFALRPFPGWSRYKTPIDRLYMCGASTWPGAGLGAGSGYLLGKRLARRRIPSWSP